MDELSVRIVIFAACVFFSALASSAANKLKHVIFEIPFWKLVLGGLSTPAVFFILIGGFFFVPWYLVLIIVPVAWIIAVVALAAIVGVPVRPDAYVALFRFGWIADVFAIAGAILMAVYLFQ